MRLISITLLVIFIGICFIATQAQQPKLYLFLVSHNEDQIGYLNDVGGYNRYMQIRPALVDVTKMVKQKNMAYNYGADWVALLAIAKYDTGIFINATNGKNIVKWMKEDYNVECDPHSHESAYNYADVAYLMSQLGVTPTNTISVFLYDTVLSGGTSWEKYQSGVIGDSFPNFSWHPEILWGAANLGHIDDPLYFGVYKPKSMAEFNVHEPTNNLILCGTGCNLKLDDTSTVSYNFSIIKNTIQAIKNGDLPSNGIYMQSIFLNEGEMAEPWFLPLLDELTDSINTLVFKGQAEWKNISSIVDEWKQNNETPFAYDCDYNPVLAGTTTSNDELYDWGTEIKIIGNSNSIHVFSKDINDELKIYNHLGNIVYSVSIDKQETTINGNVFANGIYFVQYKNFTQKIILFK